MIYYSLFLTRLYISWFNVREKFLSIVKPASKILRMAISYSYLF